MRSTYIWLPLEISGTSARLTNRVNWIPNVSSQTWTAGPTESQYEGESATLTNGAVRVNCQGCSGGAAAGYIGGSGGGAVTFSGVSSQSGGRTTLRIKHMNGDSGQRYATVTVNGQSQDVAFLPSDDGQTPGSTSVHCDLQPGSSNTVVITSRQGYGPDIDRIFVPNS
jgi:hypothetical protein